ncbi:uncharacterized protein BCR38DRAFT_427482 [Pseudomassariella vexata]|uniref:Tyrosinase copper-binding domain-containing protein n=1 Tax=Pseudomassariella vexata TaxID=1141098 RepID=A0A1Y2E7P4_9PEZI|nr:uncharacterized protein BCR38DRAFT_427482 [Pseudomassariella vexata]ORY67562.1 hypothetical protein BCR38DRAFT_427482 [Pseudomassariella vexata]
MKTIFEYSVWVLAFGTSLSHATVLPRQQSSCTAPAQRTEWRSLPVVQREEYISAVQCLASKPSKLGLNSTLYDDFPYVHNQLNSQIHFVASFLPWHRWFVHIYETALRSECGYTSPMPFWDWTLDAGHMRDSPVLSNSSTSGFGGDGSGGFVSPSRPNPLTSCISTGAFTNLTVAYYAGDARPHCINRGFTDGFDEDPEMNKDMMAAWYTPAAIKNLTESNHDFENFWDALENGPHGAIHNVLGGDMVPATSPNDPLFIMHHCQIDRLWWLWQQEDASVRNRDYSGRKNQEPDETPAALGDSLQFLGLGTDVTVESVMTTETDSLCYKY